MSQNIPVAEAEGSAAPESAPTAGHPRRWWILGALSLSLMVIGLDLTVLSVALPVLVTDLKATTTELQWIMDSYILVLAALLLPAGSLGDRRRSWYPATSAAAIPTRGGTPVRSLTTGSFSRSHFPELPHSPSRVISSRRPGRRRWRGLRGGRESPSAGSPLSDGPTS